MIHSPPLTSKTERNAPPPSDILKQLFNSYMNDLNNEVVKAEKQCANPVAADLKLSTLSVQKLWVQFEEATISLSNSLQKNACIEELNQVRAQFLELKTRVGSFFKKSKEVLAGLNDDAFSLLSGFTERSAHSIKVKKQAEQAISLAEIKLKAEEKLEEIEIREKMLSLEREKERIKLSSEKSKIKRDLQFNKFRTKATDFINALDDEVSLDELPTTEQDVASWLLKTDSTNLFITTQSEDIRVRFDDKLKSASNIPYGSSTASVFNLNSVAYNSTAGRLYGNIINTTPRPSVLDPTASPYTPRTITQQYPDRSIWEPSILDPSARHLAMTELKRTPVTPFSGEPFQFKSWLRTLKHRMEPLKLAALDKLDVIEAHTIGAPRELVRNYRTTYGRRPEEAVEVILDKLESRFGTDNMAANVLIKRLHDLPDIKGSEGDHSVAIKLRNMSDLCQLVMSHMCELNELFALNLASGIEPIRRKLPLFMNNRWRIKKNDFMVAHGNRHPPFSIFCEFLESASDMLCADIIDEPMKQVVSKGKVSSQFSTLQTDVRPTSSFKCVLHQSNSHGLNECDAFKKADVSIRRLIVKSHKICFKCLGDHFAVDCSKTVKCEHCNSDNHCSLLHVNMVNRTKNVNKKPATDAKSSNVAGTNSKIIYNTNKSLCTETCKGKCGISCGKTLLVDVADECGSKLFRTYVILDEQSNQSFGASKLFNSLGINSPLSDYSLLTLSSKSKTTITGRIASGLKIKGVNEDAWYNLPPLYENNFIPDTKHEIATPQVISKLPEHAHLAHMFVPCDDEAEVGLLLGRDAGDLLFSRTVNEHAPFIHITKLGWAVVGDICTGHRSGDKFCTLRSECSMEHYSAVMQFDNDGVFTKYKDDESLDLSYEDKKFIRLITNNATVNEEGHIEMPLPFRKLEPCMPDNQRPVYLRQHNTLQRMKKDDTMLQNCISAMQKNIDANHVEEVPNKQLLYEAGKAWFIPIFPVVHPKKNKVRLVFDSAASYSGVSLNSALLRGPNQNNDLRGVLMRFRAHNVAAVADIEAMYHSFHVSPEHRDYLRFYWFKDNKPENPITQFRARVHVFGNTSSPAVAIAGLHKVAEWMEDRWSESHVQGIVGRVSQFIKQSFYVDDSLFSTSTPEEAIAVMTAAKDELARYQIRLHKIVCNNQTVLNAFPQCDLGEVSDVLELCQPQIHSTLGVAWHVNRDEFTFKLDLHERPFTRRGILSIVNSIFDPIGLACPVTLEGKLLQREIINNHGDNSVIDWDEPLSIEHKQSWQNWLNSLENLSQLVIPRCFIPVKFCVAHRSLHVYADASKEAIGYVIYLRSVSFENNIHVAFVVAGNKVAPKGATSIPRLELCAAVEASKAAFYVHSQIALSIDYVAFYTDSTVVLGYLNNQQRQFTKYVTRRIDMITCISKREQWHYIMTENNPADLATRPINCSTLLNSEWYKGPSQLWQDEVVTAVLNDSLNFPLPETEQKTSAITLASKTNVSLFTTLFEREHSWAFILNVIARIFVFTWKLIYKIRLKLGMEVASRQVDDAREAAFFAIIRDAQCEAFGILSSDKSPVASSNPLYTLDLFIDNRGIVRVGGRLQQSQLPFDQKHPIIIPANHPICSVLVQHYHESTGHQGRHVTLGAIRDSNFFLQHGSKVVKKHISKCVTCKRLRGTTEVQQMASLPSDRTEMTPPFTNCGCDVMGPWKIQDGNSTRRSNSVKKAWAVLFTCMYSRAVHVELIVSLDTSSFKNALRRFISIRGPCKMMRSDRGTNFTGAVNQDLDIQHVKNFLRDEGCQWLFNPPHASHFGGVWERKVGQIRRAMDAALLQTGPRLLTRDELHTVLYEAAAIVNATPLYEVSADPNDPKPITPSMLLTLKPNHIYDVTYTDPTDLTAYGKLRWKKVQYIADQFWVRWRKSYLQELQQRYKWQVKKKSLAVGDVVILREKTVPRNLWPTGIIHKVKQSSDGLVRSVVVKIVKTVNKQIKIFYYERPVGELVLLVRSKQ